MPVIEKPERVVKREQQTQRDEIAGDHAEDPNGYRIDWFHYPVSLIAAPYANTFRSLTFLFSVLRLMPRKSAARSFTPPQ